MIQALLNSLSPAIDAQKSAPSVEGELNLENQLSQTDFASELDSQLFAHPDLQTAHLIDPEMTQKVDALIAPEVEQKLLENPLLLDSSEEGEIPGAKLPTSVQHEATKKVGDLNKELPQLVSGEDFVQQKTVLPRKHLNSAPYGMTQQLKASQDLNLSKEQIVQGVETKQSPMNSQQFLLQMMGDQQPVSLEASKTDAPVFSMNEIKSSQPQQILNQISDYIVQAKMAKEPTINLKVNHQELGMIDITVQKAAHHHEAVAINIATQSNEGTQFFQQNSKDLLSHLSTAGVSVSDLKLETSSSSSSKDFDFNQHQQKQAQGEKQFGSEQNQRRQESQRREDLWKQFSQEAA